MKKTLLSLIIVVFFLAAGTAWSTPEDDVSTYRSFFQKRFPELTWKAYADGVYSIDAAAKENWEAIEEFPPYEIAIEDGEALFGKPFRNGKGYSDCFPDAGKGVYQQYPHWDKERKEVMTLALAINECRTSNGEKALPYLKGELASLLAYLASTSRGHKIQVAVPKEDLGAVAAYEAGKQFYFARRGQLNFSCAHCHFMYSGFNLRSDKLSPALGHPTGWPTYRAKWGEVGTLHRRFRGCNQQVRAKPLKAQSIEYRNLEYFLTHMSNGLELNGPSARR